MIIKNNTEKRKKETENYKKQLAKEPVKRKRSLPEESQKRARIKEEVDDFSEIIGKFCQILLKEPQVP